MMTINTADRLVGSWGIERVMKETISDVTREIGQAFRSYRDMASKAKIDPATITNLLRDKRLTYDLAVQIATNLNLNGDLRRRFFRAMNYADPDPGSGFAVESLLETAEERPDELTYEPDLDDLTVQAASGSPISDHDREILERAVRALRAQQRKRQGRE